METINRKYMVEIQDREDFDNIIMQSDWFDTIDEAKQWFDELQFINDEFCTATIMSSEFDDDDGCYGDIDCEEFLIDFEEKE